MDKEKTLQEMLGEITLAKNKRLAHVCTGCNQSNCKKGTCSHFIAEQKAVNDWYKQEVKKMRASYAARRKKKYGKTRECNRYDNQTEKNN